MAGALRRDRQPVQLARETDGEIADVDHLLHFAEAFLENLARFERHEAAERLLFLAQAISEQTHEFAASRCGHIAPCGERGARRAEGGVHVGGGVLLHPADDSARDR
jgi:hypothetical protein